MRILLLAIMLTFTGCYEESSSYDPPKPKKNDDVTKQDKVSSTRADYADFDPNNPAQHGPWIAPECYDPVDMVEVMPRFYFVEFTLNMSMNKGSWLWEITESTQGADLFQFFAEDQDNVLVVEGFRRKEYLQSIWPWFEQQIITPLDIDPRLPTRNYQEVAVDADRAFAESLAVEWFLPVVVRYAKQN